MIVARILRRGVEVLVLVFAAYGFVSVPLGKYTAWEHLQAILGTQEAKQAGREFKQAGVRFVDRIANEQNVPPRPVRGAPVLPELGKLGVELLDVPTDSLGTDAGTIGRTRGE